MTLLQLPRTITPTQRQVIDLLWEGKRVKAIAKELGMTAATVRSHIRSVAAKLENHHNLPAVRLIRTYDPKNIEREADE